MADTAHGLVQRDLLQSAVDLAIRVQRCLHPLKGQQVRRLVAQRRECALNKFGAARAVEYAVGVRPVA